MILGRWGEGVMTAPASVIHDTRKFSSYSPGRGDPRRIATTGLHDDFQHFKVIIGIARRDPCRTRRLRKRWIGSFLDTCSHEPDGSEDYPMWKWSLSDPQKPPCALGSVQRLKSRRCQSQRRLSSSASVLAKRFPRRLEPVRGGFVGFISDLFSC